MGKWYTVVEKCFVRRGDTVDHAILFILRRVVCILCILNKVSESSEIYYWWLSAWDRFLSRWIPNWERVCVARRCDVAVVRLLHNLLCAYFIVKYMCIGMCVRIVSAELPDSKACQFSRRKRLLLERNALCTMKNRLYSFKTILSIE